MNHSVNMTNEFKKSALIEIKKLFPYADGNQILKIAQIMWDLMPKIYNKTSIDNVLDKQSLSIFLGELK